MKIIDKSEFETKAIKDLEFGDIFKYANIVYMKIDIAAKDRYTCGIPVVKLSEGTIKYMTDINAEVKLLDAELHIKYKYQG